MKTYEDLLELAGRLEVPASERERTVEWCDPNEVLGLARQHGGAYELFIASDRLRAQSPAVGRHLHYDRWTASRGAEFAANRVVLPSDPVFLPVVAFLAEELLRNGVCVAPQRGFSMTEGVMELALRRLALEEEAALGLIGELMFLEVLLSVAESSSDRALCLEAWRGYQRSQHDFVFGARGSVEVTVTRGPTSSHQITSISQVEPRRAPGGAPAEFLYLLSIGLAPQADGASGNFVSVASATDAVLRRLGPSSDRGHRTELQELFLVRLQEYGGGVGRGYAHDAMRDWEVYNAPYVQRFGRAYDMSVDAIEVLRKADVVRYRHLVSESVTYVVSLPDSIDGVGNPRTDLHRLAREIVRP